MHRIIRDTARTVRTIFVVHRRGFGKPDLRGACEYVEGGAFEHGKPRIWRAVRARQWSGPAIVAGGDSQLPSERDQLQRSVIVQVPCSATHTEASQQTLESLFSQRAAQ
jgi:hypothetical protein